MPTKDEAIVKVRRTGTSNAMTLPKKFDDFIRNLPIPYLKVTQKSDQGRCFLVVEGLWADKHPIIKPAEVKNDAT